MLARLALLVSLPCVARAITFTLAPEEHRCVSELVPAKSLLAGDWTISEKGDSHTTVVAPGDEQVFSNHEVHGHFAVTAKANGVHKVCIANNGTASRTATVNIKTALEVSDHKTVAKKEHVEAIEAELDRMKKMAVHVYEEMLYMRTRSETMQARVRAALAAPPDARPLATRLARNAPPVASLPCRGDCPRAPDLSRTGDQ